MKTIFTLDCGDLTITWPHALSPADVDDAAQIFSLTLKAMSRQAKGQSLIAPDPALEHHDFWPGSVAAPQNCGTCGKTADQHRKLAEGQ